MKITDTSCDDLLTFMICRWHCCLQI